MVFVSLDLDSPWTLRCAAIAMSSLSLHKGCCFIVTINQWSTRCMPQMWIRYSHSHTMHVSVFILIHLYPYLYTSTSVSTSTNTPINIFLWINVFPARMSVAPAHRYQRRKHNDSFRACAQKSSGVFRDVRSAIRAERVYLLVSRWARPALSRLADIISLRQRWSTSTRPWFPLHLLSVVTLLTSYMDV